MWHAVIETLEARQLLAAGGGWLAGGLVGDYYANDTFSGAATFSRRDIRLDFDWGSLQRPGGSTAPGYRDVPADNYSVRWTGQLMPRFSESYTFSAVADDRFKLEIKPAGSSTWTTLLDQTSYNGAPTTASQALIANQAYDVRVEYVEVAGEAKAKLRWSSPSTPDEVIDTATEIGFNVSGTWGQAFTDLIKSSRNTWESVDSLPQPGTDANGWPTGDGKYVWQESLNQGLGLNPMERGRITFSFNGRATPALQGNYQSGSLNSSYDPATNLTTGSFLSRDLDINASSFLFRNTDRDGDYGADGIADRDGITNIKLMKPIAPDATTSFDPDSLFQPETRSALMNYFTVLRMELNNGNQESDWSDRTPPSWPNQSHGKNTPRIYSVGGPRSNGASWEHKIMLANETGRDLYINFPMSASGWSTTDVNSYVYKLALMIRYGSDGVNPYSSAQADPLYPPLNANLRVYVELSNEYWNYGGDAFRQYWDLDALVKADADAFLLGTTTDPRGHAADFPILNYDNRSTAKDASGNYVETGNWRKRKMILRMVQISDIFRAINGDAAMHSRIRPLYMWQYEDANSTASDALNFMEQYFNNSDGISHVAQPHAPSYYLFGGGGATYYGSGSEWGVTDHLSDSSFETPVLPAGYNALPEGSVWTFGGTAGIARDGGSGDDIPPAWNGSQMAYLTGTGTMERSFALPATQTSDVYAISFKSVQRGTNTQKFRIFIDGVAANARSFSQGGGYTPVAYDASDPWYSHVVFWTRSAYYQTITFTGAAGSSHTVRFEGINAGQTAFIEDVRLSSVDAMFEAGMPSGGAFAAGQTPSGVYQERLNAQASWAAAYGLVYSTYEGGWACGGDTGGSPLQNHAKYVDPRAASVNLLALHIFDRAGGYLNTMGTYAQWPSWADSTRAEGLLNISAYQLMAGQTDYMDLLPDPLSNGFTLTPQLSLTYAQRSISSSINGTRINTNGWMSWSVNAPAAGTYNIIVDSTAGGMLKVIVDGNIEGSFASADGLTHAPVRIFLSRGLHSIRVKATGGSFDVMGISINSGPATDVGMALAVYDGVGMVVANPAMIPDSAAAGVLASNVTRGPGLEPGGGFTNGFYSCPIDNVWATTLAGAITQNEYFQFTVTAPSGREMEIKGIDLRTWCQNNRVYSLGLTYSLDGVSFTQVGVTGPLDLMHADLSGMADLQRVGATVTFRLYFFSGIGNYETAGIGNHAGNDLVVYGSVLPVASSLGIFTAADDIGGPTPAGSTNESEGIYTLTGGGNDIGGVADQFHFASKDISAGGEIIARVSTMTNSHADAKAGVMFRGSTASDSPFALVAQMPSGEIGFFWRNPGETATWNGARVGEATTAKWVRLVRSGDLFTAYYADTIASPADGDWIQVGTAQAIVMGNVVKAGLAVTSHNPASLCSATFAGVSLSDSLPAIASFRVNDGHVQRSHVSSVTVTYTEPVTLTSALLLTTRSGAAIPDTTVNVTDAGDGKTYTLTFSGPAVVGASLADGLYMLSVVGAGTSDATGNALPGDSTFAFNRLFGDSDGDRDVDIADQSRFKSALNRPAGYVWYFDYDADSVISSVDHAQFKLRLKRPLL